MIIIRYHYDWEFKEDGVTIKPISLGMVSDDNRELYIINSAEVRAFQERDYFNKLDQTDLWLKENVFNHITEDDLAQYGFDFSIKEQKFQAALAVYRFIMDIDWSKDNNIELWGYFAAYDHVCLSQLFGKMIDLPSGMPMWTNDLMTISNRRPKPDRPNELPLHHALSDAKYQKLILEAWS